MNIHSTCTTSTGKPSESFTIEKLKEAIEALKLPEHPIVTWMKQQGKPPEEWSLILPASLEPEFEGFLPGIISFTKLLDKDCLFFKRDCADFRTDPAFRTILRTRTN